MQERHAGFDVVLRLVTQAIHLLAHDGSSVRERAVRPPLDVLARFGDPTPVLVDPAGRVPAEIVGESLAEAAGDSLRGRRVLVLAPDAWGPHRHDLIIALLRELGARPSIYPETDFLLEQREAAPAEGYRALWLRAGSELTTAALVHRKDGSWVRAHRVEASWGGDDIDDQLVQFVRRRLPDSTPTEALRTACREARERLSDHVTAAVTTSTGSVYLHRKDVEELAAPSARAALTSTLGQVLALGDQAPMPVLISGGMARTPLVAQLASEISDQPIRLVDWRDIVTPLLLRPAVGPMAVSPDRDDTLPLTDRSDPERRPARKSRRRVPFLAAIAGGVVVLTFATVGASQIGGTDLMRDILGDNSASVPGGPPGAYAAPQTPAPGSAGSRSPAVLTNTAANDPGQLRPGEPAASPGVPDGSPAVPGASAPSPNAPSANPPAPAPAPAPAPPAPAPAPVAPAPVAPAPVAPAPSKTTAPPPASLTTAPPPTSTTTAPPPTSSTEAPITAEPPAPANPTTSQNTPTTAADAPTP